MKYSIASIQNQLRNIAHKENKTHQLLLIRYFTERLIYRISISSYKNQFCLKGGALLYAIEQETSRPTMDLDLLGLHIANEQSNLQTIFQDISQIACEEDGVSFISDAISTSEIRKEGRYSGVRVKMEAKLGNIRQILQIDIGFGDAVTPAPIQILYPILLDMPQPQIIAYSVETVIAEKFEAMITLGEQNSRMKDFYDVFMLLKSHQYDDVVLKAAINNTFQARKTIVDKNHTVFTNNFAENPKRQQEWNAFLTKMGKNMVVERVEFVTIMSCIVEQLQPIYDTLT